MAKSPVDSLVQACTKKSDAVIKATNLSTAEACEFVKALTRKQFEVGIVDGGAIKDKNDLFQAVAKAFSFPGHFGNNWDALLDCLSDMAWLPAEGYVGLLLNDDEFRDADKKTHGLFVETCEDAAERFASDNIVFKLVCCSDGKKK